MKFRFTLVIALLFVSPAFNAKAQSADPLSSWNDGPTKTAIIKFVQGVTDESSPHFVPASKRIATFDNDGTLWSEQPVYFQLLFAIDRVKALAKDHPEWKEQQPFKAVLENDQDALVASGKAGLLKIIAVTHAGMTTDEFEEIVIDWINTAKHPETGKLYKEMVYQPMLEVLQYLRANGFKTFIVSGGGIEFMRPWAEEVYGIPPEQVVGSSIKVKYEERDGKPVLIRLPEIDFIDDKEGKPVGIHSHIGRAPIAAFGNSDGDFQMLKWTDRKPHTLKVLVHHTDEKREWAYDRNSHIGGLDKALDHAREHDWTVIDMKKDWKRVYPVP